MRVATAASSPSPAASSVRPARRATTRARLPARRSSSAPATPTRTCRGREWRRAPPCSSEWAPRCASCATPASATPSPRTSLRTRARSSRALCLVDRNARDPRASLLDDRHAHGALLAVAHHRQRHVVADAGRLEAVEQVVDALHPLAVDEDDDVAEAQPSPAFLQTDDAGAIGGPALLHLLHR